MGETQTVAALLACEGRGEGKGREEPLGGPILSALCERGKSRAVSEDKSQCERATRARVQAFSLPSQSRAVKIKPLTARDLKTSEK